MKYRFKRGDEILTSYPFAHVIQSSHRGQVCDHCVNRSEQLLRCSKCKIAYYCNRGCQAAAWPDHKVECSRMNEEPGIASRIATEARFLAKILVKLKGKDPKEVTEDVLGQRRSFSDLVSNAKHIKKDIERMARFWYFRGSVKRLLGEEWLPENEMDLEVYGKAFINSYTICDEFRGYVGMGLYIGPSIFDHSCDPNAQFVFDGHKLVVRAMKDIACDTIAGITISYLDLLDTRKGRMGKLRKHYYFDCTCSRCSAEEATECMTEKSPALTSEAAALWSAFQLLGVPTLGDYARFLRLAEDFMAANGLPENDIAQAKARRLASYCSSGCLSKSAFPHLVATVDVSRKCYGPFCTTYSTLLYNIAVALDNDGRLEDALKYYKEAEEAMEVSHGKRHPHFKRLIEVKQTCTLALEGKEKGIPYFEVFAKRYGFPL